MSGHRGATLAEVLAALTILSIGAAGAMAMLHAASAGIHRAEVGLRAALVASQVVSGAEEDGGEVVTDVGSFRWQRLPSHGIELRYDPPGGAPGAREWRLAPEPPGDEAPP